MADRPSQLLGNYEFPGTVTMTGTATLPDGTITNAKVHAAAAIAHTKAEHRYQARTVQGSTGAVVAGTEMIYYAYRPQTVLGGTVTVATIADSTGRTITVDVQKSTAGSTYSTILSAALVCNSTNTTARTPRALSLSGTPTMLQGDVLRTTVAIAGSTGTQALGLLVAVNLVEDPA